MVRRRALLLAGLLPLGCAVPEAADPSRRSGPASLRPRLVPGGFLAPPTPVVGGPQRPGTGMFVKLVAPTALALRGNELLVVDSGAGRLWRLDVAFQTLTPIAGAPTLPGTPVALGPDGSAWVLDAPARQLLRFARDGRLMQTVRSSAAAPLPTTFALADEGGAVLVADASLSQWAEWRPVGAFPTTVAVAGVGPIGALAAARDAVFLLDRPAGVVHRVGRDGALLATFGRGELKQPDGLAVDRSGRVVAVADAFEQAVRVFVDAAASRTLVPPELGVTRIGAIALDGRTLAVADPLAGQVALVDLEVPR